jgi:NhaP-type Na+/H+ or K+/H+ antiporter
LIILQAAVLSGSDEVSALALVPMKSYPRLGALIFGEGVLNDCLSIVLFNALRTMSPALEVFFSNISQNETSYTYKSFNEPYTINDLNNKQNNSSNGFDLSENISISYIENISKSESPDDALLFASLIGAVAIQLFVSCAIGLFCGLLNARFLKLFPSISKNPIQQTSLILLFGLLAYSIAESLNVSGILALFVAAVILAHYSWYSLSHSAQISTKLSLCALADIAEGFSFAYVGLSMWQFTSDQTDIGFCIYMLMVVIAVRFFTIITICFILSLTNKHFAAITFSEQLGFGFGGIVRGCLCWAQILQVKNFQLLVTTTLFIVITTTVGCGFLFPWIMPLFVTEESLHPYHKKVEDMDVLSMDDHYGSEDMGSDCVIDSVGNNIDYMRKPSLDSLPKYESSSFVHSPQSSVDNNHTFGNMRHKTLSLSKRLYILWARFDEQFMKKWFGGSAAAQSRSSILQKAEEFTDYQILFSTSLMTYNHQGYHSRLARSNDMDSIDSELGDGIDSEYTYEKRIVDISEAFDDESSEKDHEIGFDEEFISNVRAEDEELESIRYALEKGMDVDKDLIRNIVLRTNLRTKSSKRKFALRTFNTSSLPTVSAAVVQESNDDDNEETRLIQSKTTINSYDSNYGSLYRDRNKYDLKLRMKRQDESDSPHKMAVELSVPKSTNNREYRDDIEDSKHASING